jgi:hypothetical protein
LTAFRISKVLFMFLFCFFGGRIKRDFLVVPYHPVAENGYCEIQKSGLTTFEVLLSFNVESSLHKRINFQPRLWYPGGQGEKLWVIKTHPFKISEGDAVLWNFPPPSFPRLSQTNSPSFTGVSGEYRREFEKPTDNHWNNRTGFKQRVFSF